MQETKIKITQSKQDGLVELQGKSQKQGDVVTPLVVKSAKLNFENSGINGVCSCVCIGDCTCDTSW
jgi:hypothetical protein